MKALKISFFAIAITTIFSLSSCSVQSGMQGFDDIYYNPKDANQYQEVEKMTSRSSNYDVDKHKNYADNSRTYNERLRTQSSSQNSEAQNNQESSNYNDSQDSLNYKNSTQETYSDDSYLNYDEDDYYDYAYSARIRRFHSPYVWSSYYDDFYTNLYWYNYNPMSWGTSIYLGYSFWYPSYYNHNPYWGYSSFGYSPWGYNYWGYNPYYYGWGYSPYNNICYYVLNCNLTF